MKGLLRSIFINFIVLYLLSSIYPGLVITKETSVLISASVLWTLLNKVIKPIIKLLLLPINLLTLGLFSWVVNVLTLYLFQSLIRGVKVSAFVFPGFYYQGFTIPSIHFTVFASYIITSLLLYLVYKIIVWLVKS